jgi:hypothetical protein
MPSIRATHPVFVLALVLAGAKPALAGHPLVLVPTNPPAGNGPSLSLGRVGLDPCPGGYCRPAPHGNLFTYLTPGTRPIEPVPGLLLRIPLNTP